MWSPTHINITVHRARSLLCKGKAGTNDCYATMHLGKDKYQTSIKEKIKDPVWQEECDFPVSEQKSVLKIAVYHRNLLGLDKFLGQVAISLDQFQLYERPRSRWFALKGKPGSTKPEKYRGEVEVTVAYMVHSLSGSYVGLNKSEKTSKSLSIKSLAHTVGDKLNMKWPSKSNLSIKSSSRSDVSSGAFSAQSASQKSLSDSNSPTDATKTLASCKDQMSSLASLVEMSEDTPDSVLPPDDSVPSSATPSPEYSDKAASDGMQRHGREVATEMMNGEAYTKKTAAELVKMTAPEKFKRFKEGSAVKCYTLGHPGRNLPQVSAYEMHEMEEYRRTSQELQRTKYVLSNDSLNRFSSYEKEDLIKLIVEQKNEISKKDSYIRDLEDYIDNLLVKVIETQPKLLQNPYEQPNTNASHLSSTKKLTLTSPAPLIPPSSTMPPGVYISSSWNESAPPSVKKQPALKTSRKQLIITSPFKKLQALIK